MKTLILKNIIRNSNRFNVILNNLAGISSDLPIFVL